VLSPLVDESNSDISSDKIANDLVGAVENLGALGVFVDVGAVSHIHSEVV